jgi:membrane protease YdiL (CAAX protease family)
MRFPARLFLLHHRLRPIWRFALFLALYIAIGQLLDVILPKIGFPDRSMTWPVLALNELLDFAIVAAIAWLMSRIERERFSAYGFPLVPGAGSLFAKGLLWGLAFLGVGFAEEFTFRGYSLKTLAESIGFWPAAAILSSLFGLVHLVFKPNEGWIDPISVSLYGLFWCLTLRRTGSLWFAAGFHAASDYTDMVVFAEPNTGNEGKPLPGHLLDVRFHGPDWLTGGPRGTEASLLVFAVLAALFYAFHRAWPPRRAKSAPEVLTASLPVND